MEDNKCMVVKFKGYLKFIDLGLPSGTKWAAYNVGATSPYETGDYFSWGNVDGHAAGAGYDFSVANYDASDGAALTGDIPANAIYDAARANFGTNAKLPTRTQFTELIANCTLEWISVNGVSGMRFTSNINGESIFLPSTGTYYGTSFIDSNIGYYYSSTYVNVSKAICCTVNSEGASPGNASRSLGRAVRAVM